MKSTLLQPRAAELVTAAAAASNDASPFPGALLTAFSVASDEKPPDDFHASPTQSGEAFSSSLSGSVEKSLSMGKAESHFALDNGDGFLASR